MGRRSRSRSFGGGLVSLAVGAMFLAFLPGAYAAAGEGIPLSELFPDVVFDPAIPTQIEMLGFEPGEKPIHHAELIAYLNAIADASPRARLITYSKSHEGRDLVCFAVSDEVTISRLEDFRTEHAKRVDPRGRAASRDVSVLGQSKAVAWLAYGIHGDELSSVDAAVAVAYRLVAGEDELTRRLRGELVILIDPNENPDGRERYLAQTTAFAHATPNPDMEDLSHTTLWPWGRGNHYLFDLNRDWFSMVHPESRRSAMIASWNPQLMVDSHEMGAEDTYLFSPPRHPFNPHLPPSHHNWMYRFGEDQARALDVHGYPYYTGEWNEEFFPGYGSSWASFLGAVGILYEMSGTSGTVVRKPEGTERTFPQAIEHQVTSSMANLTTLVNNRAEILKDFVADRRLAMEKARKGPIGAWILPEGRNPERTHRLVNLLRQQGIEVYRSVSASPSISGLRDAHTGRKVGSGELTGPVWLVSLEQPAARLVRAILDPHVPMEAEFLREEREYLERGKGTRLYEITAWSLLLSYGIEAYWTSAIKIDDGWKDEPVPELRGRIETGNDVFGYLIEGAPDQVTTALADMLQSDIHVKVAEKPFSVGGRSYGHGSLLITREGNPDDLEDRLKRVSDTWKVEIDATMTAKADSGPDLGGNRFHTLVRPRIGILTGMPVSTSSYGALWYMMDEEIHLRFTAIDISRIGWTDLSRYNVLIFPSVWGGAEGYKRVIGEAGFGRIKDWIEAGGTAIGIRSGAEFLADIDNELTKTRLRSQALEKYPPVVLGPGPAEALAGGPLRAIGLRAPDDTGKDENDKKGKGKPALPEFKGSSPYDVAPILGDGARPFAEGYDIGTPVELKPVDLATWLTPYLTPGKMKPDKEDLETADERLRRFGAQGVFLRIELDPDAWLSWGLPGEIPALIRHPDALMAEPPVQVAARFTDIENLHLGGLLWPEAAGRLTHTAYVTREQVGRGQVILFLNSPEIRGWTLATRRLLLNALLFGPGVGAHWSTPW